MKKTITYLTGIVLLASILLAGACSKAQGPKLKKEQRKVEIICKVVEVKGAKHLEMYNHTEPNSKVIDTLQTDVWPGTRVTWIWVKDSESEVFVKIGPERKGKVIPGNARKVPFTRKFRLRIPRDAPQPSEREKYDIEFKDKGGKTVTIDPYLRIPKKPAAS